MGGSDAQPRHDGLFFHPFDAVDGSQAVALGEQGQAFANRFLWPPPSVEDRADRLDKCATADTTLIALDTSWCVTEFANVAQIKLSVRATACVPAKALWCYERSVTHRALLRSVCDGHDTSTTKG